MSSRRRIVWCLLALVLLAAQTLAQMHQQVHAYKLQPGQGLAEAQLAEPAEGDGVAQLFAGHKAGDCRLYDQLGHADSLPAMPVLVLPLAPCAFILQFLQGEVLARWAALFDARGPPPAR
jgi:hypothetical protein